MTETAKKTEPKLWEIDDYSDDEKIAMIPGEKLAETLKALEKTIKSEPYKEKREFWEHQEDMIFREIARRKAGKSVEQQNLEEFLMDIKGELFHERIEADTELLEAKEYNAASAEDFEKYSKDAAEAEAKAEAEEKTQIYEAEWQRKKREEARKAEKQKEWLKAERARREAIGKAEQSKLEKLTNRYRKRLAARNAKKLREWNKAA